VVAQYVHNSGFNLQHKQNKTENSPAQTKTTHFLNSVQRPLICNSQPTSEFCKYADPTNPNSLIGY
jgi:hypothetical protein